MSSATRGPLRSKEDLLRLFRKAGVRPGMNLIVHSAMSSLGWVVNGPNDVIDALLKILGPRGTLLMPSHTGDKSDPSQWRNPPVPRNWVAKLRRSMRPFDPKTTPIRNRGAVADAFLLYGGVFRSRHPLESVAAKGRRARWFTRSHPLHQSEGIESPVGRLYQARGHALLLGVGLSSNTAFHLAEFLADVPYLKETRVRALAPRGKRNHFVQLERYPSSSAGFARIEGVLLRRGLLRRTRDRGTVLRLIPIRPAVDFLVAKLRRDSSYLLRTC